MISRTGFTGDLGYELWTTPDRALALWDQLFEAGAPWGIRPIGTRRAEPCADRGRVHHHQHGFRPRRPGVREDRARSPFEMGLDWLIDWDKGHFTGRRALLAEKDERRIRAGRWSGWTSRGTSRWTAR